MGPLIPLAAIGAGIYAVKRWFDAKKAPAAPSASDAAYDTSGAPGPGQPQDGGGSSGGGGGGGGQAPGDPGYPMSTDPTYTGQPMSLNQMGSMLKQLTQPKVMTAQERAASPTASSFAARASSIPSTYLTTGPAPVPAPTAPTAPAPKTFSSITAAVSSSPALLIKPGTTGKTFSR